MPGCGMIPASNDARTFGVPQMSGLSNSGPDLEAADSAADSTFLFIDRYSEPSKWGGTLRSQSTVLISTNTTLAKPLVTTPSMGIQVAAGAVLTLAAQPVLPNRQVFYGAGSVRFAPSAAVPEYVVSPEWWGGASFSDKLDHLARSCKAVKCLVVLTKSYGLRRPWRLTPNLLPWSGTNAELHPEGSNTKGVVFSGGTYNPRRRVELPRLQYFGNAVTLEDVNGLWLYLGNIKFVKAAVVVAPRTAIRNTQVEAYSVVSSNNIFTIQARGTGTPALRNVYLRSYMLVKAAPGVSNINWFRSCVSLVNTTIESSLLNGNEPKSKNTLLRSDCAAGIRDLTWRVTTMNYAHPNGWNVVAGAFTNLRSYVRLGQAISSSGGTMNMQGSGNVVDWASMAFAPKDWVEMARSQQPGTTPMVGNSNVVMLPDISTWPANEVRTYYVYHVMMTGKTNGSTMSLGPHNQSRIPSGLRKQNPGIVVDGLEDQGESVKYQLAIRLRNVSGKTLTQAEVDFPAPIQFRLQVGVPSMQPQLRRRQG